MTIRVRLTILVALVMAALAAVSLWLGLATLRDVAAQGALDPRVDVLLSWLEFEQFDEGGPFDEQGAFIEDGAFAEDGTFIEDGAFAEGFDDVVAFDPSIVTDQITDDLQSVFRSDEVWEPAIPRSTTVQLVEEFGHGGVLYVSAIGFVDPSFGVPELLWTVDDSGKVLGIDGVDEVPDGVAVVPAATLFDLVDYSVIEAFETIEDIEGFDDGEVAAAARPEKARLVFERIEFDGTEYGIVADASDELSAIDSVRGLLWATALVLAVLATLATWFISGRVLAPVGAMTRKVDLLSSSDLQERLPGADRGDEVGRLAATLNRMLGRLETSDRQRRRFVSDASHELRTPLAVLTNQAEVARSAPESTSLDELAQVVQGETGRLTSMVEDLLLLARHDELNASPNVGSAGAMVAFDFDDIVLDEVSRSRRLPVDGSAVSAGRVTGDPGAAARAVGHLLDNAARHGRTKVAVGLATDGDSVKLIVEDDGDGIAEDSQEHIFERFTRLDESRTRDRGGAGLGLSVVQATFGAMGGSVAVDRSPLGGARFLVTLPAA